jgi:hypothetical protein
VQAKCACRTLTFTQKGLSHSSQRVMIEEMEVTLAFFKLQGEHIHYLKKSEYNESKLTHIKELMLKVQIKYNELCTEKKWKTDKQ